MHDVILHDFLEHQTREGLELASQTDLIDVEPLDGPPTQRYDVIMRCRGLTRVSDRIVECDFWTAHIVFADNHLRRIDPVRLITLLPSPHHPNCFASRVCLGTGTYAGKPLVEIIYDLFALITFQRFAAHDGIDPAVCAWARSNVSRFPIDPRPLKWRAPAPEQSASGRGV